MKEVGLARAVGSNCAAGYGQLCICDCTLKSIGCTQGRTNCVDLVAEGFSYGLVLIAFEPFDDHLHSQRGLGPALLKPGVVNICAS